MPYTIYKIRHENKYQVVNKKTGKIHAHKTTYKNAIKQIRLMSLMDCKKNNNKKKNIPHPKKPQNFYFALKSQRVHSTNSNK